MEEGVVGLAKGMGKGVAGLVLRPTGGLIDLASGGLDTVRRSPHYLCTTEILLILSTGVRH